MNDKKEATKEKSKIKAMLLSGAVLPGLGQLYQKKKILGGVIIFLTISSLYVLLSAATEEINKAADRIIRSGNTDMMKIFEESHQVTANLEQSGFYLAFYLLIACWIFATFEVFRK